MPFFETLCFFPPDSGLQAALLADKTHEASRGHEGRGGAVLSPYPCPSRGAVKESTQILSKKRVYVSQFIPFFLPGGKSYVLSIFPRFNVESFRGQAPCCDVRLKVLKTKLSFVCRSMLYNLLIVFFARNIHDRSCWIKASTSIQG